MKRRKESATKRLFPKVVLSPSSVGSEESLVGDETSAHTSSSSIAYEQQFLSSNSAAGLFRIWSKAWAERGDSGVSRFFLPLASRRLYVARHILQFPSINLYFPLRLPTRSFHI